MPRAGPPPRFAPRGDVMREGYAHERTRYRYPIGIALAIALAAGGVRVLCLRGPEIRPLCIASAVPASPRALGPTWYWLEHTSGESLLIRARSGREVVVRAPRIPAFAVAPNVLAWIAFGDGVYRVVLGNAAGHARQELWRGREQADGLWTEGSRAAWLVQRTPPRTAARALPPLGPVTEVWLLEGGVVRRVALLAEGFRGARVVGAFGDRLYVCGLRSESIPVSVIYEVPVHGSPRRVAGEYGPVAAMLRGGELLWTAPSRESNSLLTACVRSCDLRSRTVRTLADWLPAGGTPYRVGDRILLCAGLTETAWLVDERARSGSPVTVSGDLWPIAAGEDGLLAVQRRKTPGRVAVSVVKLP